MQADRHDVGAVLLPAAAILVSSVQPYTHLFIHIHTYKTRDTALS